MELADAEVIKLGRESIERLKQRVYINRTSKSRRRYRKSIGYRRPRHTRRDVERWKALRGRVSYLSGLYENAASTVLGQRVRIFNYALALKSQRNWRYVVRLDACLRGHRVDATSYVWTLVRGPWVPQHLRFPSISTLSSPKAVEMYYDIQSQPDHREMIRAYSRDNFWRDIESQILKSRNRLLDVEGGRMYRELVEGLFESPYYQMVSSVYQAAGRAGELSREILDPINCAYHVSQGDVLIQHILERERKAVEELWGDTPLIEGTDEEWLVEEYPKTYQYLGGKW